MVVLKVIELLTESEQKLERCGSEGCIRSIKVAARHQGGMD